MRPDSSQRAISTVIDATFALLLISASMVLLTTYLQTGTDVEADQTNYDEADQIVETLNAMEVSADVSVANTLSDETWYDESRPIEGTAAELLAEAAVANTEINGAQYQNSNFEGQLEGSIMNYLAQSGTNAQIRAVWEPNKHAPVRGEVVVGDDPPGDAEISTATMSVPSGLSGGDSVDTEYYAATAGNAPADALIAARIVESFFPPIDSQYLLEQDSKEREIIEYRYKRMGHILFRYGGGTVADAAAIDEQFGIEEFPDAVILNNILIEMLRKDIQTDPRVPADEQEADMTVDITVQTW